MIRVLAPTNGRGPAGGLLRAVLLVGAVAGCGDGGPARVPAADTPALERVVLVASAPVHDLTTALLAGTGVEAELLCPPGANPASWRPPRDVLARCQRAMLVVTNGAGLEDWTRWAALPPSRLVVAADGIDPERLVHRDAVTHSHGGSGSHTHAPLVAQVWLDPELAGAQAHAIARRLRAALPASAETIDTNLARVTTALDEVARVWREAARMSNGRALYAAHGGYDYLARAFGFEIRTVGLDPLGVGDDELDRLRTIVDGRGGLLWWQRTPDAAVAAATRALGLRNVVVRTGAIRRTGEAVGLDRSVAIQRANVARLREASAR